MAPTSATAAKATSWLRMGTPAQVPFLCPRPLPERYPFPLYPAPKESLLGRRHTEHAEALASHQSRSPVPVTSWLCDFGHMLPESDLRFLFRKVKMPVLTSVE